jgi:hypothetical protein
VAISAYLLWHKALKNSRYTEGYACEFLKSFCHQHLSTPHPQKSLNSGIRQILNPAIFFVNREVTRRYAKI